MNFIKKIIHYLFAYNDKEKIKPRPKVPRKVKLTYQGEIRPKTKYIIENQISKKLEDFNVRVDDCTQWIDKHWAFYVMHPLSIMHKLAELDKNELLAFRAAMSKHRYSSHLFGRFVARDVKRRLEKSGHKYVYRARKH